MARWLKGRVIENRHWTDTLFSIRAAVEPFPFIPGQFIKLALEVNGERVARPYSLVNPPGVAEVECFLALVPEGPLSPALHALRTGDDILVSQPAAGFFTLDELPGGRHLWLLATGTGIGPYLSILQTDAPWQRFRRINLVHSVRRRAELVYQDMIQTWERNSPGTFRYQPIVTREACPDALDRRITELITSGALEMALQDRLGSDSQVMLCGNPRMVEDCSRVLKDRGLRKNLRRRPGQVTVERYW